MKRSWKKWIFGSLSWKRLLGSLVFVYLCLLMVAVFFADRFIFLPPESTYVRDLDRLEVLTGPPELPLLHYEARGNYPTIIWSHGNAEDLGGVTNIMDALSDMGFGVVAYEYPGYGLSEGKPTEDSVNAAALQAYQYVREELGVPPGKIVLCGQSVGSGPTLWLASQVPHVRVILIAPFMSAFRTATRIPLFPGDRFENHKRIGEVSSPLLIIHGTEDRVISFSHGKKLFKLSPSRSKFFFPVEGAGHNNLYKSFSEKIFLAIHAFASPA